MHMVLGANAEHIQTHKRYMHLSYKQQDFTIRANEFSLPRTQPPLSLDVHYIWTCIFAFLARCNLFEHRPGVRQKELAALDKE